MQVAVIAFLLAISPVGGPEGAKWAISFPDAFQTLVCTPKDRGSFVEVRTFSNNGRVDEYTTFVRNRSCATLKDEERRNSLVDGHEHFIP